MAQIPHNAELYSAEGIKMMVMLEDIQDDLVGAAA